MSSPINVTWNGEAFEPANRFWATKCDQRFVVGQAYTLDEVHSRSHASHAHYFAVLHDIWQSLPERLLARFPSDEHLRKYALIKTGYATETKHVCKTPAEAERLALALEPYDTFQIVQTDETVVTVWHAISQDMRAMDKQTFQKSKEAVLDFCSELVGIEPTETRRLAGLPVNESSDPSPAGASDVDDAPRPEQSSSELEGTPVPPPSGSQSSEPDMFGKFNFGQGEFVHLCDFARKALDDASSDSDTPAKEAAVDRLFMSYREVIESDDGKQAMNAMGVPLAAVINGKRSREMAAEYIARELLGCSAAELEKIRHG